MSAALRIDLGADNAFSLAVFKGYMSISSSAPKGCKYQEDGAELRLELPTELEPGTVYEIMKWLGAATKGNSPIRVLEPEAYSTHVAIPHESGGNKRWQCPRCARDVMHGVNDAGTIEGLCKDCHAVDMRLVGAPVHSPSTPSAPVAATPSAAPSSPAIVPLGVQTIPATTPAAPSSAPALELGQVPVVARARDLPPAATHRFAIWGHRLCYSDGEHWRWLEGFIPSLE